MGQPKLDRSSPIPIYYQIAIDLRQWIAAGEWRAQGKLPKEADLAVQHGVSRMTLRQALALLEDDGIIDRQVGRGTFIRGNPDPIVPTLSFPASFSRQVRELGLNPATRVVVAELIPARDRETAAHLGLSPRERVAHFRRVFLANDRPISLSDSMIPHRLCKGITSVGLVNESLTDTLMQLYGLNPTELDQWLDVARADEEEAGLLGVAPDSPLLVVTSLSHLKDGTPVEYAVTKCVADRLRLHIHVSADAGVRAGLV